jgi:1-acyl-sn-glycerol-3-phosphate acyltransferase
MGTFFTPNQSRPAARAHCFRKAEEVLRRTGASVCLSPEGTRVTNGSIGAFNKGSFHLATNLKVPIVPLYIDIPPEVDPGKGWQVAPGTAHLHILPEIRTDDWSLEDLDTNREKVHSVYLDFHRNLAVAALAAHPSHTTAADMVEA